jgi:hypothetical protein
MLRHQLFPSSPMPAMSSNAVPAPVADQAGASLASRKRSRGAIVSVLIGVSLGLSGKVKSCRTLRCADVQLGETCAWRTPSPELRARPRRSSRCTADAADAADAVEARLAPRAIQLAPASRGPIRSRPAPRRRPGRRWCTSRQTRAAAFLGGGRSNQAEPSRRACRLQGLVEPSEVRSCRRPAALRRHDDALRGHCTALVLEADPPVP